MCFAYALGFSEEAHKEFSIFAEADDEKHLPQTNFYQSFLSRNAEEQYHSYTHILGKSKDIPNDQKQFTLLNISVGGAQDIEKQIIDANADLVCLQGIPSYKEGHAYYSKLKELYAHFYIETCNANIALVASKYRIQNPFFIPLESDKGLFDFQIFSEEAPVGHVYLIKADSGHLPESIIRKIEEDYLSSTGTIPFIFCGDSMFSSCSVELLGEGYLFTRQKHWFNGVLSTVQPKTDAPNNWEWFFENSSTILCGGSAEVSVSQDTEGNTSLEGSVSVSDRTESGDKYSAEVSGKVDRDNSGNTSASVEVSAKYEW